MDETKVLDCSFMDDDSFSTMKDVVTDMAENGTEYVTCTAEENRYSHYLSFDWGLLAAGVAVIAGGAVNYLWDRHKAKKASKK